MPAVRNWLVRHAQNAIGSLGALSRNPIGTAMTVAVIGVALALPAALDVLVDNAQATAARWSEVRDFSIYLKPDTSEARASALAGELSRDARLSAVRLITPDQALAELAADAGFAGALAALEDNPLPPTLVVSPRSDLSAAELEGMSKAWRANPDVDLVKLDLEWIARLNAALDFVRRLGTMAAVLLGLAVIIVVGNTIRLDIQNRAEEIEVAKLLGATDGFVRRPFLYLGLWYGFGGAATALLILAAGDLLLSGPVDALAELYGARFSLAGPAGDTAAWVITGGILAGWAGAWTAVARHLHLIQPRA